MMRSLDRQAMEGTRRAIVANLKSQDGAAMSDLAAYAKDATENGGMDGLAAIMSRASQLAGQGQEALGQALVRETSAVYAAGGLDAASAFTAAVGRVRDAAGADAAAGNENLSSLLAISRNIRTSGADAAAVATGMQRLADRLGALNPQEMGSYLKGIRAGMAQGINAIDPF